MHNNDNSAVNKNIPSWS